jgi:hypothetical protein
MTNAIEAERDVSLDEPDHGRDQRAVVSRCTAVNATAADEMIVKYSQLKLQREPGAPRRSPPRRLKSAVPSTASTSETVRKMAGIGRDEAATTSSRVGTGLRAGSRFLPRGLRVGRAAPP